MKVIFLDHDGVICLSPQWGSRFKNKEGLDGIFDRFDSKAINVLNQIIDTTDCEIVVSSDWRYDVSLATMQEIYRIRGIRKPPIDFTPTELYDDDIPAGYTLYSGWDAQQTRCLEIQKWIKNHPEVTNWIAVDDMNLSDDYIYTSDSHKSKWGLKNFVRTPLAMEGIKQSGIKQKIIKILNS